MCGSVSKYGNKFCLFINVVSRKKHSRLLIVVSGKMNVMYNGESLFLERMEGNCRKMKTVFAHCILLFVKGLFNDVVCYSDYIPPI